MIHYFHIVKQRITARHAASAVAVMATLYFSFTQFQSDRRRQERDLELSSTLLTDSLREAAEPLIGYGDPDRLGMLVERFGRRGRLFGMAIFDAKGKLVAATKSLQDRLQPPPKTVQDCLARQTEVQAYEKLGGTRMLADALPLHVEHGATGAVASFSDPGYIESRQIRSGITNAKRMVIQGVVFLLAIWIFGFFIR